MKGNGPGFCQLKIKPKRPRPRLPCITQTINGKGTSHVKFGQMEKLQRAIDEEENDKLLELNERYKSNANKSDKSDVTSTTESLTSSSESHSKRSGLETESN